MKWKQKLNWKNRIKVPATHIFLPAIHIYSPTLHQPLTFDGNVRGRGGTRPGHAQFLTGRSLIASVFAPATHIYLSIDAPPCCLSICLWRDLLTEKSLPQSLQVGLSTLFGLSGHFLSCSWTPDLYTKDLSLQ